MEVSVDIPVYLVNGFLESGKTTFIKTTLEDRDFTDGSDILLIICEEGEEEYDNSALNKLHVQTVTVESRDAFNKDFFNECQNKYKPKKIIIEINGMWKMEEFLDMDTPKDWVTVQIITLVDASTYSNYLVNMRGLIMEQVKYSDTIIFNRCTEETKRMELRRSIKPVNRKAQIIYETENGIDLGEEEEELPFDISGNEIVIGDDDFGLWYLDALDYPKKYEGKKISFKAQVYKDKRMPKGTFVPGRFAMQCCANDIAFIGFFCRIPSTLKDVLEAMENRSWAYVKAEVRVEFRKEYRGKGPVLYATELYVSERAEEEVAYFT